MNDSDLFLFAQSLAPVSREEWDSFTTHFTLRKANKGDLLLKVGEPAKSIFIVRSGILRNYDVDESGKEHTKLFRGPGGILAPYAEILTQTKTKYFIQAVTDSEILSFPYAIFEKMMDEHKNWERLGRKLAEMNFLEKEKREYDLLHYEASIRYSQFLKDFDGLSENIPQYQVASYLGISPEALNRLIKKLKGTTEP